uniref:Myosin tail domain-containing protein n=1 Tax=Echeneis naucrates TaxID=173247 RepID=A0A665WDI4_ECHNA
MQASRVGAGQQIDVLLKKITQAEIENEHLRRNLSETESRVEELMDLRKEEQDNIKTAVHMTKSVEATRVHLQGQLHNKEAENNRLTAKLRTLERTLTEQKMEIDDLRASITTLTEKAAQDQESLKKATRAQKVRAERFEAAIEKCYAQLKEKDAQLASARVERDSRRRQKEQMTDEKDKLDAQVELLNSQIAEMTARLQKEKSELSAANETVMQRVEKLSAENGDLSINNAALKASVAQLEQQLSDCESALIEEKVVSQERKHQAEQSQHQVAQLQAEIEDLRIKYANISREMEEMCDGQDAAAEKVKPCLLQVLSASFQRLTLKFLVIFQQILTALLHLSQYVQPCSSCGWMASQWAVAFFLCFSSCMCLNKILSFGNPAQQNTSNANNCSSSV